MKFPGITEGFSLGVNSGGILVLTDSRYGEFDVPISQNADETDVYPVTALDNGYSILEVWEGFSEFVKMVYPLINDGTSIIYSAGNGSVPSIISMRLPVEPLDPVLVYFGGVNEEDFVNISLLTDEMSKSTWMKVAKSIGEYDFDTLLELVEGKYEFFSMFSSDPGYDFSKLWLPHSKTGYRAKLINFSSDWEEQFPEACSIYRQIHEIRD